MGHGNKSSLKAALHSQQSRLHKKEKAAQAARVSEQKNKHSGGNAKSAKAKGKGKGKAPPPRTIVPFSPSDQILLIGEGNFSFARALFSSSLPQLKHLAPENITATAYDSERDCFEKYPDAEEIVALLKSKGVRVIFSVDASKLERVPELKGRRWDRIVWNFPHAGKGITDQNRNILSNQMLMLGFFRSAALHLKTGHIPVFSAAKRKRPSNDSDDDSPATRHIFYGEDNDIVDSSELRAGARGTILVTLRNVPPYTSWDVPRLAKKPPPPTTATASSNPEYIILRSFVFHRDTYVGYEHRMTKGERAQGRGTTGEGGEDRTWEFCLKD